MAQIGDSGTLTIRWTLASRSEIGEPPFDWAVEPSSSLLTDEDIAALLSEIAERL